MANDYQCLYGVPLAEWEKRYPDCTPQECALKVEERFGMQWVVTPSNSGLSYYPDGDAGARAMWYDDLIRMHKAMITGTFEPPAYLASDYREKNKLPIIGMTMEQRSRVAALFEQMMEIPAVAHLRRCQEARSWIMTDRLDIRGKTRSFDAFHLAPTEG